MNSPDDHKFSANEATAFSISETVAFMAGVDPMDVCLDSDPGTINLRIDLHPEAVITPATVDEIRKHFHFLRAVTATLELKSRSYEGYDLEKTINQIMRNEYLAYLDRVKEPTTPVVETRIVQYDLPPEFPVSVRKHLNRFYNEKAMTMEEAERFQAFNIFTYRYVGGRYRSIYFEEPDIRAVLQKYSYNDKFFNPVKNPETAEISDTGNSKIPLIQWTANNADFAELITELFEKKYITADSPTDALRIAASHFSGVGQSAKSLLQGKANRGAKAGKFAGIPIAAAPKKK